MQFSVPQYIDVEDKIVGPFTIKQFLYLAGGGGIVFLLWKLLPTFIAVIFIVPVALLTWALTFFPKERYGRQFIDILESAFHFAISTRLYTWKKEQRKTKHEVDLTHTAPRSNPALPRVVEGKMKNLSWNLEVSSGTSVANDTPDDR
jgi:hypothetical protein